MAERKRPRRTRERILATSLDLFNRFGEPRITTADIANEMNISPGNLYYHFRNKDEIVVELYAAFDAEVRPLLSAPEGRRIDVEDFWLLVHLLLERMQAYRFLYRDVADLALRQRPLGSRFARLLRDGEATMRTIFAGMRDAGELDASDDALAALARNAMLNITQSMTYERLCHADRADAGDADLNRVAHHVLMLIEPHLVGPARALISRISRDYLAVGSPSRGNAGAVQ